jgi:hypothetical protein
MLCCLAEIGSFIFGIIALVRGQFSLTRSRVVQKVPARIIGVLLLLPLLAGQGIGFIMGAAKGVEFAAKGKEFTMQDAMNLQGPLLVVNVLATAVPLLAAFIIAVVTAKPPKPKRRRSGDEEEYDEDYDDRPRRRRRPDDEEEDDDGASKRRRRDDDDEPPRRRGPDDRFREKP